MRRPWMTLGGALAALVGFHPAAAQASDAPPSPDPDPTAAVPAALVPSPGWRTLAVGTSLIPGVLLHGSGHFTLGRRNTAYRIFAAEGVGLGGAVLGVGILAASGANRYLTAPSAVLAIGGVGMFGTALVSDIVGTAWPLADRGMPATTRPYVEVELGYRAVHDPQFAYAHLMKQRLDASLYGWRLSPEMWLALDDTNARMRFEVAYRPVGPRSDRASSDGSFVDVRTAVTHHRFAPEGFRTLTAEVASRGRLDLARYDDFLLGQFAELEIGVAVQTFDYDLGGVDDDHETLLLTRFAHGVYIGKPPEPPYGEVLHFYDHRHDTYAGV